MLGMMFESGMACGIVAKSGMSKAVAGSGAGNHAKVQNTTRKQLKQIEDLRKGKDVSVNTVEEA